MVQTYWQVGREIVEEEQRGADRAAYGVCLIDTLAEQLTSEFGKGFTARGLLFVREVYLAFPILYAVHRQRARQPTIRSAVCRRAAPPARGLAPPRVRRPRPRPADRVLAAARDRSRMAH